MSSSPEISNNNPNVDMFLSMAPLLSPINAKGSNFAFSPLSLRALVCLIAAGAGGPTLQQLLSFLNADSIDEVNARSSELVSSVLAYSGGPKISFVNALWIQEGLSLKHSYKQVVDNVHKASSYQLDFLNSTEEEVISEVNSWAEEQTNGLIKEFLEPGSIRPLTKLIHANALYFKGRWLEEEYFDESETKDYDFHLLGGDSVKVPFMTGEYEHPIGCFDGFKVLCLSYDHGENYKRQFSMYILLPDAKDGLPSLMEKVVSEPDFLDNHDLFDTRSMDFVVDKFRLPRFKISVGFKASESLKQLGLSLPFEGGLSEMVEGVDDDLFVSEIFHKCFIEVNERGTEAAAVSASDICPGYSMYEPPKVDFVADHPFMFLIREDTSGVVLFFGHVLNPLEK